MARQKGQNKTESKDNTASTPKGNDSSRNQADKTSSKKENQGKSRGEGKRPGSQGKQGNR
jgi:hypothetical protein